MKANLIWLITGLTLLQSLMCTRVCAQNSEALSITMESYPYPFPVQFIHLTIEGQDVKMAYMDVKPTKQANGRTVTLFHGKNFFGAYWEQTIRFLAENGFRVVVPDQIGFGKSSKPAIHYSFHLLASNTRALLDTLGIRQTAVIGHSMGGMVASRFALMYPSAVTQLILENPIGLEDYRRFVPYSSIEELYQEEMRKTEEQIRQYQKNYYVQWKPDYDTYVQVPVRQMRSGDYPRLALSAALTTHMIYQQPVVYEFPLIQAPSLLVIGQADRTVVGKAKVPKDKLSEVGQYPQLGKSAAKLIPNAKLVELPNIGHIPHFEATERFHQEILTFLSR